MPDSYEAWEKDCYYDLHVGEEQWKIQFGSEAALIRPDGTYPLNRGVVSVLIDLLKTARDKDRLAPIELDSDEPKGGST